MGLTAGDDSLVIDGSVVIPLAMDDSPASESDNVYDIIYRC